MLFGLFGWTTICVSTDMVAHDELPTHNWVIAALNFHVLRSHCQDGLAVGPQNMEEPRGLPLSSTE
jgi:hypothetical protein